MIKKLKQALLSGFALSLLLAIGFPMAAGASPTRVLVTPNHMRGWFFYNDENDQVDNSLGSFVNGPGNTPLGEGSVQISVSGTQRRNLATYQFANTKLAKIQALKYSTYNASAGNGGSVNRSGYLNFNVDFDGSDTWQRRLVYLPSDNGAIVQNQWQQWDVIAGGNAKWRYSGATWPVTGEPGTTTKTWSQIVAQYPGVSVRKTDGWMGIRVGEPYQDGYTENIDKFVFKTKNEKKVFNFEPAPNKPEDKDDCKHGGWKDFGHKYRNQGQCIKDVEQDEHDWHHHHWGGWKWDWDD